MISARDLSIILTCLVGKTGIDHAGISSDFDGVGGIEGWNDSSEAFNVTFELVKRGYSQEDIGKS